MSWGRSFRRFLRLPSRSAHTIDRDVNDEVAFHLEMRTAELRARGLAAREAQTQAQREFGDIERARAALRAADGDTERVGRRSRWLAELSQDLSFGWRQLARRPGFAFVAVLTLGLGIGANTAIVSAVRGILLQPLPFDRPEQLYRIQSQFKDRHTAVSVPDFEDFQRDTRTFSSLTAYYESTANFTSEGDPQRWASTRVTSRFFSTLRVRPLLGRVYAEGEDREGGPLLAVLSEGLWRNAFGADPAVIGRTLQLDGQPAQVIGVVPSAGTYPEGTDLWLPSQFTANDRSAGNRGARWLRVIGRLADSATLERASADLGRTAARLATEDPKHNTGYGVSIIGLRESLVGDMRKPLYVLLGAVALLMLVSCANVAGLQLGRTMARDGELAVRTALGAGRGRMIRQLLAENVTLALLGAAAGYLIAIGGTRLFARLAPPDMPRLEMMRVDLTMLAFTVGVAVVTGVLFGLIPALNASHEGLHLRLREGSRGSGGRAARARARQTPGRRDRPRRWCCSSALVCSFDRLPGCAPWIRALSLRATPPLR
ncbi:MAG: ABC transporter permease [Gemmatimonadaceae bacterium]